MHRRLLAALLLLLVAAWVVGPGPGFADDKPTPKPGEKPGAKPGEKKPDDAPDDPDQADDKVSFVDEVNKAIALGTAWLKAKPEIFPFEEAQAAHWGLIHGEQKYDPNSTGVEYRHPAGPTALALYTLLKCGVDPKDKVIEQGFHWLRAEHAITMEHDAWDAPTWRRRHTKAAGSYEVSAMILALTARYDAWKRNKNSADAARKGKLKMEKEDLEWLHELVAGLIERRGAPVENPAPADKLGWRYNLLEYTDQRTSGGGRTGRTLTETFKRPGFTVPGGNQDMSSTQLAALALYNAQRFGAKVDPQVWLDIVEFTLSFQEETGPEHKRHDPSYTSGGYAAPVDHARGFKYLKGHSEGSHDKATGSMTACGLTNLVLARDLFTNDEKLDKLWKEKELGPKVEKAIFDSLAWLDRNWSAFENKNSQVGYHIYYLYALERSMDMLGKNLVGTHLWYTEGARSILDRQTKVKVEKKGADVDGVFWNTNATHDPKDVLDTCFALLFLKRATKGLVPPPNVTGGDAAPADNR